MELQLQRVGLAVDLEFPLRRLVDDVEVELAVAHMHDVAVGGIDIDQEVGAVGEADGCGMWIPAREVMTGLSLLIDNDRAKISLADETCPRPAHGRAWHPPAHRPR